MELDPKVKDPVQVGLGEAAARVKELTPITAARGRNEGTLLVMVQASQAADGAADEAAD